jgi:hypothetical protein
MTVLPNHFDRRKPFYPLVIHFVAAIHGFMDMASRNACLSANDFLKQGTPLEEIPEPLRSFCGAQVTPLLGNIKLSCKSQADAIGVDIDQLSAEVLNGGSGLVAYTTRTTAFTLALAWDSTESHHDTQPLWQFLRHCRNAAAHNGKFFFKNGQPEYPAIWQGIEITRALQGTPLIAGEDGIGLLRPGDVLRLLWDIEQAYPQMSIS